MPAPTAANATLLLLGCGRMGGALLKGWLSAPHLPYSQILVVDPSGLPEDVPPSAAVRAIARPEDLPAATRIDAAVLAVKPQIMDAACAALKPWIAPETLILSIAAGQDMASFQRRFRNDQPIIRAMPNTPAAIGRGISVCVATPNVSTAEKHIAQTLLEAAGAVEWVEDESLMDAVTALSGSGPAYVFFLMEALAQAGTEIGLPPDLARILARRTVEGSAALSAASPDIAPEDLRRAVTSPGGTTEAALKVLTDAQNGLPPLLQKTLTAATKRGRELRGA